MQLPGVRCRHGALLLIFPRAVSFAAKLYHHDEIGPGAQRRVFGGAEVDPRAGFSGEEGL